MKNSFKNLSYPELKVKRDELRRKYMDFRFQMVIGHVDNPLQKRVLRRQLARLHTLITAHEKASNQAVPPATSPAAPAAEKVSAEKKA